MCLGVCVRPVKVKVGFSSKLNFFFLTLSLPASSENDKKIFISDDPDWAIFESSWRQNF